MPGILGRKIGMTQIFGQDGSAVPVTVVEASPNVVLQKKMVDHDGYEAVQLGFEDKREKLATKPALGHAKKAGATPKRFIREVSGLSSADLEIGQQLSVDQFTPGDFVDVTGISKGKGTAGAIKRWGFARGKMTHGSKYHRGNGSLATMRDANRVPKGKKMHGRMGSETITIQNLEVIKIDLERNVLLIKGSVPGARNCLLKIRTAVKK